MIEKILQYLILFDNWSKINFKCKINLGTLLIIEGAEGQCGGNNVKTELFRTISRDRNGNIVSQTFDNTDRKHKIYAIEIHT